MMRKHVGWGADWDGAPSDDEPRDIKLDREPPKSMREVFDLDYHGYADGKVDWTFSRNQDHAKYIMRRK